MEKTFDELIDYKFGMQFDKSEKEEIKELMQQIREATIAEIWDLIMKGEKPLTEIKNLPTDRSELPAHAIGDGLGFGSQHSY